ncbi:hypothetical protein VTJ49DRAFT_4100 [Mycothermus thermophilus]|uniref:Uncharacterized protein n=1 Tax=Humicola insolens TaxID=85995 RepID=A0ABR3V740_HUMIN
MASQEPAPSTAPPPAENKAASPEQKKPEDAPPPTSATTAAAATAGSPAPAATENAVTGNDGVNPVDFEGNVETNHELPTLETIRKIDNYVVLDSDGKSHTFRSLYTGRHTARRVLIIFVRHFFCGNCQEYLRTLSESITPSSLLALPQPTFICVVGCGDPALIPMYAAATGCQFPIYSDPTRRLYDELGMVRTLALGPRPAYARQSLFKVIGQSIAQGLKQIPAGLALKSGDSKQVGGEFLFEPLPGSKTANPATPMDVVGAPETWGKHAGVAPTAAAPAPAAAPIEAGTGTENTGTKEGEGKDANNNNNNNNNNVSRSETSLDGKLEPNAEGEDKIVTWCHRMRNTRDHAEIPELMEVLGLDGTGKPVGDPERWARAVGQRKGTGMSASGRASWERAAA